jgi:hypothetical protein
MDLNLPSVYRYANDSDGLCQPPMVPVSAIWQPVKIRWIATRPVHP